MSSWASFHSKTLDRKKLMDELQYMHDQYDLGNVKSWDLDGARQRLLPQIAKLSDTLDEEYRYLWTRTGVGETLTEWRARVADWTHEDYLADAEAYYSREKRRERNRQEQARLYKLAAQREARDQRRSQEAADAATA